MGKGGKGKMGKVAEAAARAALAAADEAWQWQEGWQDEWATDDGSNAWAGSSTDVPAATTVWNQAMCTEVMSRILNHAFAHAC